MGWTLSSSVATTSRLPHEWSWKRLLFTPESCLPLWPAPDSKALPGQGWGVLLEAQREVGDPCQGGSCLGEGTYPSSFSTSGIEAPLMHSMRAQSFPTLCDPMNYNPPGSSDRGISQAGILGCPSLLQRIVPTQGLNPSLQHWQEDCSPLSHL